MLAAVATSLFATWHGPGVTADSVNYLWMARHLLEGRPLAGVGGHELTVFPPGYPALLALGDALGAAPVTAARWIAAASWGVTVLATAAALRRRSPGHPGVVLAGAAAVLVAPAVLSVMSMAWSEAPFVAVVAVFLMLADRCRARGRATRADLVQLVLLLWAAWSLRYAGLVLLPVGMVALWPRRGDVGRFALAALLVPMLWSVHNLTSDGSLMGPRNPSSATLRGDLADVVSTAARWLSPTPVAGAAILLAVTALIVLARPASGSDLPEGDPHRQPGAHELVVWISFVAMFVGLTIGSHLSTQLDALGDRLLVPVLAPTVVLVGSGTARLLDRHPSRVRASRLLGVAVAAWVGAGLVVAVGGLRAGWERGPSHLERRFGGSQLVVWTEQLPDDVPVLSNQSEALAYLSGREVVTDPPASSPYGWTRPDPTGERLVEALRCEGPSQLVWFDDTPEHFLAPERLPASVLRTQVLTTRDGHVERLELADASTGGGACED